MSARRLALIFAAESLCAPVSLACSAAGPSGKEGPTAGEAVATLVPATSPSIPSPLPALEQDTGEGRVVPAASAPGESREPPLPVPSQIPFPTPAESGSRPGSSRTYVPSPTDFAIAITLADHAQLPAGTSPSDLFQDYVAVYVVQTGLDDRPVSAVGFILQTPPRQLGHLAYEQLVEMTSRYDADERSELLAAAGAPKTLDAAELVCDLCSVALQTGQARRAETAGAETPCEQLMAGYASSPGSFIGHARNELGLGSGAQIGAPASQAAVLENLPADLTVEAYQGRDELGGDQLLFSQIVLRGRPVVLNFWAGLCPSLPL